MSASAVDLLFAHAARFNAGVRSGDFGPMVAQFAEDAVMRFEGVPVGPFVGREAIAAAYREQPPDDEIEIVDARLGADGSVVARYAWRRDGGVAAGDVRLATRAGEITSLTITFDARG